MIVPGGIDQGKICGWKWPPLELRPQLGVPTERQAIYVERQGQRSKDAKAKEGADNSGRVVIYMTLARAVLATVHGSSRDSKVGGPCFLH